MAVSTQSTKFLTRNGRRIFIGPKGKSFAKTKAGKPVYGVKAARVTNKNGDRKLRPNNLAAIPSVLRPKRVATKRVKAAKSPPTKLASRMFRTAVRNAKKQGYNARDNESIAVRNRKTGGKATLKARRDESKGMRKAAGKRPYVDRGMRVRKVRKNKGVARKTNSQWAADMFARLVNKPVRKTRKNAGKARVLIASPGGTVYKGLAALRRNLAKMNKKI